MDALWAMLEGYLPHHGPRGASTETLKTYKTGMTKFIGWAQDNAVSLLRPRRNMSSGYVGWLLETQRLSASTGRTYVAAARNLYVALRWAGATKADPFHDVRVAPERTAPEEKRHGSGTPLPAPCAPRARSRLTVAARQTGSRLASQRS
ncbi:hypothetical protein GCM10008955_30210 [Deinococcus malanensis]|uniref:Core-binding (CB) domain-containing protein n=2 Tax=Deinococcus malanensis TaxID=1706855 RepID=A0ABQ2EZD3_9DEIO|nr:hypothetical protein GCM10008955_30210 [Deinococcus malanensis]